VLAKKTEAPAGSIALWGQSGSFAELLDHYRHALDALGKEKGLLKVNGRVTVVVPDNVLFEGGAGEYPTITCRPMKLACRCSRTTADGRCRINGCDWSGAARGLTVPVGRRIPGRALDWLERYATEQARPLIHTEQRLTPGGYAVDRQAIGYGPPEFQEEIRCLAGAGAKVW